MKLMSDIRAAILADTFPDFVRTFMFEFFKNKKYTDQEDSEFYKGQLMHDSGYPLWIVNSLESVGITLD